MLEGILYIAYGVLAIILGVMVRQVARALTSFTPPSLFSPLGPEVDLPSVTICIPARNEQHALIRCLESVLASKYQKLEIIVLDDVSGDDTSALIKSFANEGVRFIQGKALPSGWLGKNHALQELLEEASGSYILFMDVDTLLSPDSVEHMVRYALSNRASMVSVVPRREDGWRMSVLASPLRFFWEVIFHRRLSPGSAYNAWLIRRTVLQRRFDGFRALKNTSQPEAVFAAELAQTGEYRFLLSTPQFGVSYEKKWRSQLLTSVRLLYPLLGKQVALSILAALDMFMLLIPFVALIFSAWLHLSIFAVVLSALFCIAFCALYGVYARRVWRRGWLVGALLWPLLVMQECFLIIASAIQHKRKAVTWKGRLIRPEVQS